MESKSKDEVGKGNVTEGSDVEKVTKDETANNRENKKEEVKDSPSDNVEVSSVSPENISKSSKLTDETKSDSVKSNERDAKESATNENTELKNLKVDNGVVGEAVKENCNKSIVPTPQNVEGKVKGSEEIKDVKINTNPGKESAATDNGVDIENKEQVVECSESTSEILTGMGKDVGVAHDKKDEGETIGESSATEKKLSEEPVSKRKAKSVEEVPDKESGNSTKKAKVESSIDETAVQEHLVIFSSKNTDKDVEDKNKVQLSNNKSIADMCNIASSDSKLQDGSSVIASVTDKTEQKTKSDIQLDDVPKINPEQKPTNEGSSPVGQNKIVESLSTSDKKEVDKEDKDKLSKETSSKPAVGESKVLECSNTSDKELDKEISSEEKSSEIIAESEDKDVHDKVSTEVSSKADISTSRESEKCSEAEETAASKQKESSDEDIKQPDNGSDSTTIVLENLIKKVEQSIKKAELNALIQSSVNEEIQKDESVSKNLKNEKDQEESKMEISNVVEKDGEKKGEEKMQCDEKNAKAEESEMKAEEPEEEINVEYDTNKDDKENMKLEIEDDKVKEESEDKIKNDDDAILVSEKLPAAPDKNGKDIKEVRIAEEGAKADSGKKSNGEERQKMKVSSGIFTPRSKKENNLKSTNSKKSVSSNDVPSKKKGKSVHATEKAEADSSVTDTASGGGKKLSSMPVLTDKTAANSPGVIEISDKNDAEAKSPATSQSKKGKKKGSKENSKDLDMEIEEVDPLKDIEEILDEQNHKLAKAVEKNIIEIDIEDEDVKKKKRKKKKKKKCCNVECDETNGLVSAPVFVLTYFGLSYLKTKNQKVCLKCYDEAVDHQEHLAAVLSDHQPLLNEKCPLRKDTVTIADSDEEDSEEDEPVQDDALVEFSDNIDELVKEALEKYDINFQLEAATSIMQSKMTYLEDGFKDTQVLLDNLQKEIDLLRKDIYKDYIPRIKELHPINIDDTPVPVSETNSLAGLRYHNRMSGGKVPIRNLLSAADSGGSSPSKTPIHSPNAKLLEGQSPNRSPSGGGVAMKKVTQMRSPVSSQCFQDVLSNEVVALGQVALTPCSLPPIGPLVRPRPRIGDIMYVMKLSFFGVWSKAKVLEIVPKGSETLYKIKFESTYRKSNPVRQVTGKQMAYSSPCPTRLPVGTRVIAIFKDEEWSNTKECFYSGVIAEPPKSMNKYRYLVFFDDGYAQYVPHDKILLVSECSKNVWDDIHPDARDFVRKYLEQYPERPMVKLQQGQIVKTEWNGKWWIARVIEVDASLVKMHFDADARTEWIYRGSTRLGPLYNELANQAARKEQGGSSFSRHRGLGVASLKKRNMPYVEYTRGQDVEEILTEDGDVSTKFEDQPYAKKSTAGAMVRAVAKKSTTKRPESVDRDLYVDSTSEKREGRVEFVHLPRTYNIKFKPHQCGPSCLKDYPYDPSSLKGVNPLQIPLYRGWERLCYKHRHAGGKRVILYKAPCGRSLRNMEELHRYLRLTGANMGVDLFDFDFWVHCCAEFAIDHAFCNIKDLSYGKEFVPVPCVNPIDHSYPEYVEYSTKRLPTSGVSLNLDPDFLVGCDCTDDCQDKEKCSCWQLTVQGTAFGPGGMLDPTVGYMYKRLPEPVMTGIYECNTRCKCASTCLNRVAQHPLQLKLQVFKTVNKGWGIRCLNDIPQGSFICIYAGQLLTEQGANEDGKNYGDEYLAELDYIEVVERLKEGYESDVIEDDTLLDGTRDDAYEERESDISAPSDNEEDLNSQAMRDSDEEFRAPITSKPDQALGVTIRTRLRKRISRQNSSDSICCSKEKQDDDSSNEEKSGDMEDHPQYRARRIFDYYDTPEAFFDGTDKRRSVKLPCRLCSKHVSTTGRLTSNLIAHVKKYHPVDYEYFRNPAKDARKDGRKESSKKRGHGPEDSASVGSDDDDSRDGTRKSSWFSGLKEENSEKRHVKSLSVREIFGKDEYCYIMDAKSIGNIGRYLNHSCSPNVFVQNVFVDSHDVRFPWVAFFALTYIRAGTELTWDYNYDVGSVPGKVLYCYCNSTECRGRLL